MKHSTTANTRRFTGTGTLCFRSPRRLALGLIVLAALLPSYAFAAATYVAGIVDGVTNRTVAAATDTAPVSVQGGFNTQIGSFVNSSALGRAMADPGVVNVLTQTFADGAFSRISGGPFVLLRSSASFKIDDVTI